MSIESNQKFWNVEKVGDKNVIDLFGYVGGYTGLGGFNEEDFLQAFRAIPKEEPLEISINSFGGSVFTALSIYTLLSQHAGPVEIRVNGAAVSAATIITSAPGARVIMPKGAMMMIHRISTDASGTLDDIQEVVDRVEKLEKNVVEIYMQKTGKTEKEIRSAMEATTWLTAQEAVEFGLADEVDETNSVTNVLGDDVAVINGFKAPANVFASAPARLFQAAAHPATAAVNEEESVMDLDIDKLKAEHPDLVASLREEAAAEGRKSERERIKALEAMALPGYEKMLEKAKYESDITPEKFAMQMVQAEKKKAASQARNIFNDAKEVNGIDLGNGVETTLSDQASADEEEIKKFIAAGKKAYIGE